MKKNKKLSDSQFKKKLIIVFNQYIRWRDSDGKGLNCISCRQWIPLEKSQAGHFVSRRHENTRFDENNVHGQCFPCNIWRRGNHPFYQKNLEEKIGRKAVDEVIRKSKQIKKYSRIELESMLDFFTKELGTLKKLKS